MAKYMIITGGADLDKRSGNPNRTPEIRQRYMKWVGELQAKGSFVSAHKLRDQTGTRLTIRGGEISEGPFIETKEAIGGIFFIEAGSLEEATALSRGCPVLDLQNGYVEVRVLEEVGAGPR